MRSFFPSDPLAVAAAILLSLTVAACSGAGSTETDASGDPDSPQSDLPALSIDDVAVAADTDKATLTISLDAASSAPVQVTYATQDATAVAGEDYVHLSERLELAPGDTSAHVFVDLLTDSLQAERHFTVELSAASGATIADGSGEVTLLPNELLTDPNLEPDWADTGVFSPASSCARCHAASDGAPGVMTYQGEDVSPSGNWGHTLMAQSLADPYFQAAVVEEAGIFPNLAGAIEDGCLTCHAPMGRTHAHHSGEGLDGNGFYRLETALEEMHAREGVSCSACHQIQAGNLDTQASFSGGYDIDDDARLLFGPYTSPVTQPMAMNTQYEPVYGAQAGESALCATCHTLFTSTLDADSGEPTGEHFPEQTVYLEWRNSDYATGRSAEAQCQDCHMPEPAPGYGTQIATTPAGGMPPMGWPERSPFATHGFPGGNTHTLALLREYRDVLGIEGSTSEEGFDREIERTRQFLTSKTASITIEPVDLSDDALEIPVRVTNHAAHKLPTSYPSRRVWVELTVRDADGGLVFASGVPDGTGRLSIDTVNLQKECLAVTKDDEAFDYDQCYEPHRDRISSPDQVAVYESVLADTNGRTTYVLLQADAYLKDNRLPPAGFSRSAVPTEGTTTIIGDAEHDPDFHPETGGVGSGEDIIHYLADVAGHPAPYRIEARLLYQAVRPGFVEALHGDDPRVSRYKQMVEAIPPVVEELATDTSAY
jgi:hypothetical protein